MRAEGYNDPAARYNMNCSSMADSVNAGGTNAIQRSLIEMIVTAQLGGFAFGPQCRNWQSTAQGVGLANCRQRPVLGVRRWARGTST